MTDDRMALLDLIEKTADADLVREMLAFAAERLMAMQVEALTGAPAGVRSPERLNQRNGYRERAWETRAGRIDLAIPKLRKGSYFSTVLWKRSTIPLVCGLLDVDHSRTGWRRLRRCSAGTHRTCRLQ